MSDRLSGIILVIVFIVIIAGGIYAVVSLRNYTEKPPVYFTEIVTCYPSNDNTVKVWKTVRNTKAYYSSRIADWGTVVKDVNGKLIIEYSPGVKCSLEKEYK